ncbi:permease [Porifericola rhodea]|uniref:permease n=1 Tax=Porifericola rhodea TaxID=930972 RepID=UPI002666954C|nr:permease [Porifericola rhodea]WKN29554.1 permease [Porifericola rhodea]
MDSFFKQYAEAATTSLGFFWMALWAFVLGYAVSSMIQVFVTQERMKRTMGRADSKSVLLGTFFGFISSSCSFSALATTKSLFKKGAGFVPSMAFLLASTNLVIELGIIISIFLSWQFVVGEYVGGILLILISWLLIRLTKPSKLIKKARERLGQGDEHQMEETNWKKRIRSIQGWQQVSMKYFMEWKMVWKDVTVGFTLAGIIASFVPSSFFETLFIGSGGSEQAGSLSFLTLLEHVVVGPLAAFCTFIGSMGNIPLASLLYSNGVSFAGVMAFIFSDLVVFPVLRINAKYYGWKMSLYILFLLFTALIATSLLMHYGFLWLDILPQSQGKSAADQDHFKIDYTFFLNLAFLIISGIFAYLAFGKKNKAGHHHHEMADKGAVETVLKYLAIISYVWLAGGLIVKFFVL